MIYIEFLEKSLNITGARRANYYNSGHLKTIEVLTDELDH